MLQIAINMAMSIDGKIATKLRGPIKLGTDYDSQRMDEIRALHDLVINGASTFRAYPKPLFVSSPSLLRERIKNGLTPQPISAVVSSRLDLPKNTPYEKAKDYERWIFCGKKATVAQKKHWEKAGVRVISGKGDRPSAEEMHRAFVKAGLKNVLLEGGGELNATFLEKDLVDRIF